MSLPEPPSWDDMHDPPIPYFVPTLCVACARHTSDGPPPTCTSFPQGIPVDIVAGGADHRTSWQGELPFELDPAKVGLFELWEQQHAR